MKKTLLVLALIAPASSALAANGGTVSINGLVSSQTCVVTTANGNTADINVQLPTVKPTDITAAVSTTAVGAGQAPFELHVSECPSTLTKAKLSFTSPSYADVTNGTLKNNTSVSGYAPGVNVAIHDNTSGTIKQAMVGRANSAIEATLVNNATDFKFIASYVKANATATVGDGPVSSSAVFDITYQ